MRSARRRAIAAALAMGAIFFGFGVTVESSRPDFLEDVGVADPLPCPSIRLFAPFDARSALASFPAGPAETLDFPPGWGEDLGFVTGMKVRLGETMLASLPEQVKVYEHQLTSFASVVLLVATRRGLVVATQCGIAFSP